jgi:amidase
MTTSGGSPELTGRRVHAFGDDALGDHDGTTVAALIARGEVSRAEVAEAAISRAEQVQARVNGVHHADYERARAEAASNGGQEAPPSGGPLFGVPTYIKDNLDVQGLPTNHGTEAFVAAPAKKDDPFVVQYRSLGMTILGKTRLPEFGFSASTEYTEGEPVRNPWDLEFSAGASSGGSAALVAAGVVPVAHANDGGGSIRIPAAACGLVGLKPTRGRLVADQTERQLPVKIISQGVVTRTVRDTAAFFAGAESHWRNTKLAPVRHVVAPSATRLRVGLIVDSVTGTPTDEETRRAVLETAELLDGLGHHVTEATLPVTRTFAEDFARYWGLLGLLISVTGSRTFDPGFDVSKTDNLTKGLAARCRKELARTPGVVYRLRRSTREYRKAFDDVDLLLSPVLGHTTPRLGHLSPTLDFEELFARLETYVGFTPLNNAAGGPAISLPLGATRDGLPLVVHFSADLGDERTLLELAYELEEARPFARIQDA